ncbi:Unknown protein [Striga hermonthica]|uniref:Uncharacterized protein n=1 Tax=Striga hermonthica TaxID=68872 RepID=A0A9N7RAI7_STRHE|nr:Unknown protein [Striga hermonthica]
MTSSKGFPAVDDGDKDFLAGLISADCVTSKEIKDKYEEAERKEREKKDIQNLKTVFVITGIMVAVAGAIFAITRKLREK